MPPSNSPQLGQDRASQARDSTAGNICRPQRSRAEIVVQRHHNRAEHVLSPSILTGVEVSRAEKTIRRELERERPPAARRCASARSANTRCRSGSSIRKRLRLMETETQPSRRGSSSVRARRSASLSSSTLLREPPEQDERGAKIEPQIDGLLDRLARLRQMRQGLQRLLEAGGCLPVGRSREAPWPRPDGGSARPSPTPHPGSRGGRAARRARPGGRRRAPRWPRRSGRGGRAAAPGAGCRTPPRGSGRA